MAFYPGTTFTTIGGKIKQIVEGPSTERLLIIGTALDGPLNTPVRVEDAAQAERVFGPANYSKGYKDPTTSTESGKPAGATIPLAVAQAIAAGCKDIYAVRATGSYATAVMGVSGLLSIRSQYPGRTYNDVTVALSVSGSVYSLAWTRPLSKGGSLTLTGDASTTTLGEFMDRVNGSSSDATVVFDRNYAAAAPYLGTTLLTLSSGVIGSATLSGGTNGCMARGDDYGPEQMTTAGSGLNGYALKLVTTDTGTFDSIRNKRFRFDVAVLTGIHLDDQITNSGTAAVVGATSIAADFADFIDLCSTDIGPCHGVVATRSHNLRDDVDIISYVNGNLLDTSFGFYSQTKRWIKAGPILYNGRPKADANGLTTNLFSNISVVAGPDCVYSHPDMGGDYTHNFHVSYAALLTTTPPERSTTMAELPGVKGFNPAYPARYANKLLDGVGANPYGDLSGQGAYVVLARDPKNYDGPLVVFDDPTAAARNDYFRNYQVLHLSHSIEKDIDYVLSPFVGGPTSAAVLAAMEAKIQNVMDGYVNSNALLGGRGAGYDFKVTMQGTDQALGIVRVFIEIVPATTLRRIALVVSVRQAA